jgi:hypothetical protein
MNKSIEPTQTPLYCWRCKTITLHVVDRRTLCDACLVCGAYLGEGEEPVAGLIRWLAEHPDATAAELLAETRRQEGRR